MTRARKRPNTEPQGGTMIYFMWIRSMAPKWIDPLRSCELIVNKECVFVTIRLKFLHVALLPHDKFRSVIVVAERLPLGTRSLNSFQNGQVSNERGMQKGLGRSQNQEEELG